MVEELLVGTPGETARMTDETRAEFARLGQILDTLTIDLNRENGMVISAVFDRGAGDAWQRARIRRLER